MTSAPTLRVLSLRFRKTLRTASPQRHRNAVTSTFVESGRRESNPRSQLGKRVQPYGCGLVRTKVAVQQGGAHADGLLRTRAYAR